MNPLDGHDCPMKGIEHLDDLAKSVQEMNDRILQQGGDPEEHHLLHGESVNTMIRHFKEHHDADATSTDFQNGLLAAVGIVLSAPLPSFLTEMLATGILDVTGTLRLHTGKAKTDAAFEDIIARLDGEKGGNDSGYL